LVTTFVEKKLAIYVEALFCNIDLTTPDLMIVALYGVA
jgi:hypothetical protein